MLCLNKLLNLGIGVSFIGISLSSALPAKAWGLEYEYGVCDINTGVNTQRMTFPCFLETGGGAGAHFMSLIPEVGNGEKGSTLLTIATYFDDPDGNYTRILEWNDGTESKITGEKHEGREMTFWIKRGWAITFYPPRNEDSY